jgi:uncharacterized protein (TIGR02266 family)
MADNDKRGGERVPAAMRIRLRYPDLETFIDRYATNVSKGGIFVASRSPKPVGATVRFEFQLADGSPVVRGEGKVTWVKEFDPTHPQRPHGMGLKFTRLDAASKVILERLLARKEDRTWPDDTVEHPMPPEPGGVAAALADSSGAVPLPTEGSGPQAVLEGSGPIVDSGPTQLDGSGASGVEPVGAHDREPTATHDLDPIAAHDLDPTAAQPVGGSGATLLPRDIDTTEPAFVPEMPIMVPAVAPRPPAVVAPPAAPRPAPAPASARSAARISVRRPAPLPPAIAALPAGRALEALAVEIGFTGEMLALAFARARALVLTAEADPELAELFAGVPLPAIEARTWRSSDHGTDEATEVDRHRGGTDPSGPPAGMAHPPPDLGEPVRPSAPSGGGDSPRRGGLLTSVKKLFGK